MSELRIDPEFRDKIPPLTEAEFKQLEENIVADGEIREPIIVWNDRVGETAKDGICIREPGLYIIDGHHRWQIHGKHPEIPYKVKDMEFSDKWAAVVWMCQNQIGRRNMTSIQKQVLIAQQYEAQKKTVSNETGKNQFTEVGGENLHQANPKAPKTRAIIAQANHVNAYQQTWRSVSTEAYP